MSTIKSSAENLTLNADGANNDVIIQSNGSTKVTVDGQNSRVGIGTTAPSEILEVQGASGLDGATPPTIKIHSTSSGTWTDNATFAKLAFGSEDTTGGIACSINAFVDSTSGNNSGLSFYTSASANSPTENVRIAKDGVMSVPNGIELGSGLDGTAANTLDDYEEGTFTPRFNTSTNATYTHSQGMYTKVGNTVSVQIDVGISAFGSISGVINISGLPFTTGAGFSSGNAGWGGNLAITAGNIVSGLLDASTTRINLYVWSATTGVTNFSVSNLSADGRIMFTTTYIAA